MADNGNNTWCLQDGSLFHRVVLPHNVVDPTATCSELMNVFYSSKKDDIDFIKARCLECGKENITAQVGFVKKLRGTLAQGR